MDAQEHAAHKSFGEPYYEGGQGKLFGSVYEVSPKSSGDISSPSGAKAHIADPKGLLVGRHAAFVSHFALRQDNGLDSYPMMTET